MNRILFFIVIVVIALASCKNTKKLPQSQYTADPATQPKVFTVPETTETTKAEPTPIKDIPNSKPISIRKEQVTFTQQEDKSDNSYFVIIGSFSQLDNAKNYRETLLNEGFTPIILHSETGYYRVCVNSFKSETDARKRVTELRQTYPKYSDVWLLIKE